MNSTRRIARAVWFMARLVGLVFVMLLCYVVAAKISGIASAPAASAPSLEEVAEAHAEQPASSEQPSSNAPNDRSRDVEMFLQMLLVCVSNTVVLTFLIVRARRGSWRIMLYVGFVYFSCLTLMPQIEAIFFLDTTPAVIRRLVVMGLVLCGLFTLCAVVLLGRLRDPVEEREPAERTRISWRKWAMIAVLSTLTYAVIYLIFGYYLAWRSPVIREFYGVDELLGFWQHMSSRAVVARVIPLQLFRGLLWFLIGLTVIFMHRGRWLEVALAVALALSVLMNAQLLLPNPIMPAEVRHIHLVETATSNFLFGLLLTLIVFLGTRPSRQLAT